MSAATSPRPRRRIAGRPIPGKALLWALLALVVVAIALDTTYHDTDEPVVGPGGRVAFDRDTFGRENFAPRVLPALEEHAVNLGELLPALVADPDAAAKEFGHREGTGSPNFAVTGEGVAGKPDGSLLPVKVKGAGDVTVNVQIGPAINGTALRDASRLIKFEQFVNQVEYADASTALNNEVKAKVLADLDRNAIEGKRVSFLGAFTLLTPEAVTITPAQLEVTE